MGGPCIEEPHGVSLRLKIALALAWSLGLSVPTHAAGDSGGVSSPLLLGVGGRHMAMGRAGSALAMGADALFWNAGRMGWMDRGELSLFHSDAFVEEASVQASFLSYPTLDNGAFAIDGRDARNLSLGEFSNTETHVLAGYGRRMTSWLGGGGAVRVVQQSVADSKDTAFGLDLGLAAERPFGSNEQHRWALAIQLQNAVAPKIQLDEEAVDEPLNVRFGAGYLGRTSGERIHWALASDLEFAEMGPVRWANGLELGLDDVLHLRAGLDNGNPTFGVGAAYRGIRVDYASAYEGDLPRNDRITVAMSFGMGLDSRRVARQQNRQAEIRREMEALLARREAEQSLAAAQAARSAEIDGDYSAAIGHYRTVLLVSPGDTAALGGIDRAELAMAMAEAQGAFDSGELARAAALYQKVLDHWPEDPTAQAGYRRASQELKTAHDRQAQLDALFASALEAFGDGQLLGAKGLLDELLRSAPDHAFGRELETRLSAAIERNGLGALERARTAAAGGDFSDAFSRLDVAARYLPDRLDELDRLRSAWIEERDREPDQQPAVVRSAVATRGIDREALRATFDQGLEAFGSGDFDGATAHWQSVWSQEPNFEGVADYLVKAYLLQSVQFYGAGDYTRALARCERILEIDPSNEKARRYVARIEEEREHVLGAKESK
jgi:tetratricopeptide (TPR) repeat protein